MQQQLSLFDSLPEAEIPVTGARKVVVKSQEVDLTKLEKVYYTITEVSVMFSVNASLLRFWEKEFPVQLGKVKKNKKGDRYYNKEDLEKLKLIFYLVKEKRMTLPGAREFLKNNRRKVKDDKTFVENLKRVKEFLLALKKNIQ
ncbi:MAG: MerR family transcriptional regulator [Chitinophagaceae bacterium]|nr:MerR family transcriptional regulator [Chitinophagaceae bacterium]